MCDPQDNKVMLCGSRAVEGCALWFPEINKVPDERHYMNNQSQEASEKGASINPIVQ